MREPPNKYTCLVTYPGSVNALGWADTHGRRAIIDTRRATRNGGIGAKGTVKVQQRGSKRWKILYQCVVGKDGRLSRRGVGL